MHGFFRSIALLVLFIPAAALAQHCPPPNLDCSVDQFLTQHDGEPCIHSWCEASTNPPGPVSVTCFANGQTHDCQASPGGQDISYSWTAVSGVDLLVSGSSAFPQQQITCTGESSPGLADVVVTSPFNVSSAAYRVSVFCTTYSGD